MSCCLSILLILCSTLSSILLQHTSQTSLFINTSSSVILFICSLLLNNLCTLVTVKSSRSAQQFLLCSSTMSTLLVELISLHSSTMSKLPINTAAQFLSICSSFSAANRYSCCHSMLVNLCCLSSSQLINLHCFNSASGQNFFYNSR